MIEISIEYARFLKDKINNIPSAVAHQDENCSLSHLQWMCDQIIKNEMSLTKKNRWIGYIQGVLIARGLSTVQLERDSYRAIKQQVG